MNEHQLLAKATRSLMFKEPYYGFLILQLRTDFNKSARRMRLRKSGIAFGLDINPDWWRSLTDEQRKISLKHELIHLSLFHPFMKSNSNAYKENPGLLSYTCDLEVNQLLDYTNLPGYTDNFEAVQKELSEKIEKAKQLFKSGDKKGAQEIMKSIDNFPPAIIQYDPILYNDLKKDSAYYFNKLLEEYPNGDFPAEMLPLMDHLMQDDEWDDFTDASEEERDIASKQLVHMLKEATEEAAKSGYGDLPGEFAEVLSRFDKKQVEKFDWKGYMRRFVTGVVNEGVKYSRSRLNKRFSQNPGRMSTYKVHVCLAIDTSGSVSTKELKEIHGQMYHLSKTGCKITVVNFDTQIQSIDVFDPKKDFKVYGRGGTYFEPVITYFNENHQDYDCLMIFTDGEAPPPNENPKKKTLWILSSDSGMNHSLKESGKVIRLNK